MTTFLTVLHVVASIFLIAVVLLQRGKGAEMGAVFGGGGGSTVFGGRGAANFLTRLTSISAVIFMTTSLSLSYAFTQASEERLLDGRSELEAEALAGEAPLFEEVGIAPAIEPAATAAPAADDAEPGLLPELPAPTGADTTE